jgi:hypothetical protein
LLLNYNMLDTIEVKDASAVEVDAALPRTFLLAGSNKGQVSGFNR